MPATLENDLVFYTGGMIPPTGDYNEIENKPAINGVVLTSDTTLSDLGLADVFDYKGQKPTYNDLPKSGNKKGDVWNVADTGENYAWSGSEWDCLTGNAVVNYVNGQLESLSQPVSIDALKNVISNLETTSLKSGVLQTTVRASTDASDTCLASEKATAIAVEAKQDTLVSGTNIKTINGNSVLGSGNIDVDALPDQTGNTGKFLTTNGVSASWGDPLPSQAGNAKKVLSTDGVSVEWVAKDDYYQSLTSAQEITLTTYGTYNSELVADGTRFIKEDGTIQKFVDVATPGGFDTGIPTPPTTDVDIWFKNALITANARSGGWGEWKTTNRGVTYTQKGSFKVDSFICNNNVCIGTYSNSSSACITTDGDTWTSYTNADFLSMRTYNKVSSPSVMLMYPASASSSSNYTYSEDDGTTWVTVALSTIFEGSEFISRVVYTGNKFYMYTSGTAQRAKYVYVSSDGKNWSGRTEISLGEVRTDSYSQMYGCGDKIFYFPQYQTTAYYSTDGVNFNEVSTEMPNTYNTPVVIYCAGTQTYVALYRYSTFYMTSSNGIDWATTELPGRTASAVAFMGPADDYVLLHAGSWVRVNTGVTHAYSMEPLSLNKTEVNIALSGKQGTLTEGTGIAINNNVISANSMVGADGTNAGTAGMVPAPTATDNNKYLKGDGTWSEVQGGSSASYDISSRTIIFS